MGSNARNGIGTCCGLLLTDIVMEMNPWERCRAFQDCASARIPVDMAPALYSWTLHWGHHFQTIQSIPSDVPLM